MRSVPGLRVCPVCMVSACPHGCVVSACHHVCEDCVCSQCSSWYEVNACGPAVWLVAVSHYWSQYETSASCPGVRSVGISRCSSWYKVTQLSWKDNRPSSTLHRTSHVTGVFMPPNSIQHFLDLNTAAYRKLPNPFPRLSQDSTSYLHLRARYAALSVHGASSENSSKGNNPVVMYWCRSNWITLITAKEEMCWDMGVKPCSLQKIQWSLKVLMTSWCAYWDGVSLFRDI